MPEVEGVCSGAIASDYQRLRVESVCSRLNLTSWSLLWHQPQLKLLKGMIDSGIEAVLVKVAALGLIPEKHLGKDLRAMQDHLVTLAERYGCNVCGEGGEYETLVLDCPNFRYGRIVIDRATVKRDHESSDIAPSAVLEIEAFHVESKGLESTPQPCSQVFWVPENCYSDLNVNAKLVQVDPADVQKQDESINISRVQTEQFLYISVTCSISEKEDFDSQMMKTLFRAMLVRLLEALNETSASLTDAFFVHLFLRDMGHFGVVNEVYHQFFPSVNPPSRACVQLGMPFPCLMTVSLLRETQAVQRSVLHVQSVSSWAPCCIGPYSQATSLNHVTFIAGQLGLDAASMTFQNMTWQQEVEMALKHCQSIAVAIGGDFHRSAIKVTVFISEALLDALSEEERHTLCSMIQDQWASPGGKTPKALLWDDMEQPGARDAYLEPPGFDFYLTPVISFITVPALPKNARVEIQPLVLNRRKADLTERLTDRQPHQVSRSLSADCSCSQVHRWESDWLSAAVERATMEYASEAFQRPPTAVMLHQPSGFKIVQIQIPQPKDPHETAKLLSAIATEILNCCLCRSQQKALSATLWYNSGHMDWNLAQTVMQNIKQGMSRTDVEWSCLPALAIGSDQTMSDSVVIETVAVLLTE